MSDTYLMGELVAVGNDPDANEEQPRALIHCTREQVLSVKRLPLLEDVAVVPVAELAAMTKERDQWHAAYRDEHERRLKLQDALVEMDALRRHSDALADALEKWSQWVDGAMPFERRLSAQHYGISNAALAAYRASQTKP